jgi:hypothetical protein
VVVSAQECQLFQGIPSECGQVLEVNTTLVYLQANTTQATLAESLQPVLNELLVLPKGCAKSYTSMLCLLYFPPCFEDIGTGVCNSLCTEVEQECRGFATTPNCEEAFVSGPLQGQLVFPESDWLIKESFSDGNDSTVTYIISVNCSTVASPGLIELPECPPYFAPVPGNDSMDFACLVDCPGIIYTDADLEATHYLNSIFGLISLTLGPLVLIPHFFNKNKWRWPSQISIWILVCAFMMGLTWSIPILFYGNDWKGVVCIDATTYADGSHPVCGVQAIFVFYWDWTLMLWWFVLIVKLVLTVNNVRLNTWWEMGIIHGFVWTVPIFILIVIGSIGNNIGGNSGTPFCYLNTVKDGGWIFQLFYFIPLPLTLVQGSCCIVYVLWKLFQGEGWKGLWRQFRLILYALIYLFPNLYNIFYYYVSIIPFDDQITENATQYTECLITTQNADFCADLRKPPDVVLSIFSRLVDSCIPCSFFLIFGLQRSVFGWWVTLGKNLIWKRDKSGLLELWDYSASLSKQSPRSTRDKRGIAIRRRSNGEAPRQVITPHHRTGTSPSTTTPQAGSRPSRSFSQSSTVSPAAAVASSSRTNRSSSSSSSS